MSNTLRKAQLRLALDQIFDCCSTMRHDAINEVLNESTGLRIAEKELHYYEILDQLVRIWIKPVI